ncbi:MAG: hypothetical protein KIT36_09550 [Alphaproteobacteria bacterium]|nr:hypothetical protein [Alphaproteobacteria bacterium]
MQIARRRLLRVVAVALASPVATMTASGQAPTAPAQPEAAPSIGVAQMRADGTVVLYLRATGAGGSVGHAVLEYPPAHPQYHDVLRHLGGLQPGEVKPVPPWPD